MAVQWDISYGLAIWAGQSVRRNAGDSAFEAYTPSAGWDVSKVWTPVNNQIGVWTGDGTLEGDTALTFDTTTDTLATTLITATTVTANLTGNVTGNASGSSGSCTGNAATATSATTATNLAGGSGGTIPYQSAAGTTAMLANGTAGQVLTSAGTTLAPTWTTVWWSSWGSSITGTTGTGSLLTMGNSYAASGIGQSIIAWNTQTNAVTLLNLDTGTSNLAWNTGIKLTHLRGLSGGGIVINNFWSATQAVWNQASVYWWINFNTNSTADSYVMYWKLEQNVWAWTNTWLSFDNYNTEVSITSGSEWASFVSNQYWAWGTSMIVYWGDNVNSSTNGLINYTLSNTQSGATVIQKIDLWTSAQGHTGLLVQAYNASTTAAWIKIAASTTWTGKGIEFTWVGATGHSNITFTDKISSAASGTQYGINFVSSIMGNAGTAYGIYQETMQDSQNGGAWYGLYQNIVKNAAWTWSAYGWYVASIGSNAGWNNGRYFSLNNAQSWTGLEARSNDASEILFSRTWTHTTGTVADNFNLSYFKRTNIQNGAGGTLTATGSVLHLENVATQTAGTLTDTVPCLKLTQDNDSTGGHILFNTYTGVPLTDGTLYFDGTNFKYRAGGATKTITAV